MIRNMIGLMRNIILIDILIDAQEFESFQNVTNEKILYFLYQTLDNMMRKN